MIKAPIAVLDDVTLADLKSWQGGVDAAGDYPARVTAAAAEFKRCRQLAAFRPVLVALAEMCSGTQRCMYCEDNCADEVEHHHPKAFFPELVFAWTNFLFACARCNKRKSTKFPLFASAASTAVTFARVDPQQPASPTGTSVLLDPRRDDPDAFLRLDLVDTFRFRPVAPKGTVDHVRAVETIKVLGLNDRDELPRHRRHVYQSHISHLHRARDARRDPARSGEIPKIQSAVRGLSCAVVWHEMKRRRHDLPEVRAAFDAIPEALDW